jgi:hypothetical protein
MYVCMYSCCIFRLGFGYHDKFNLSDHDFVRIYESFAFWDSSQFALGQIDFFVKQKINTHAF